MIPTSRWWPPDGFWTRALGIPEKRIMTDTLGLTASFPGIERQDADLLKISAWATFAPRRDD
jgi:hypothetical protein